MPEGDWIAESAKYMSQSVFMFFVISGFVIPLSMDRVDYRISHLPRFIARRTIRIHLPYIASIALYLAIALAFSIANSTPFELDPSIILHHIFFTIPFTEYDWINAIYWTLAIEFQFYILIALIYPLLFNRNKMIEYISTLLFGLSGLVFTDNRLLFFYAPMFTLGIILFKMQKQSITPNLAWPMMSIFTVITFYLHGTTIGVITVFTVLMIAFVNINNKAMNWFGDISYSLYLIHGAIGGNFLYLLSRYSDNYMTDILLLIGAMVVSIIASYIFWLLIESPTSKLSRKVKIK